MMFMRRIRILLELTLTSGHARIDRLHQLEQAARDLGMTGIEIDAARVGRSFDIRLNRLLSFAAVLRSADPMAIGQARGRVLSAGGDGEDLRLIDQLTEEICRA